jgi:hypothetical protein
MHIALRCRFAPSVTGSILELNCSPNPRNSKNPDTQKPLSWALEHSVAGPARSRSAAWPFGRDRWSGDVSGIRECWVCHRSDPECERRFLSGVRCHSNPERRRTGSIDRDLSGIRSVPDHCSDLAHKPHLLRAVAAGTPIAIVRRSEPGLPIPRHWQITAECRLSMSLRNRPLL